MRARIRQWPYEPDVVHLVLLDHHMVPDSAHVTSWLDDARGQGARAMRTGALFSPSTPAFLAAGFEPIDHLVLLERPIDDYSPQGATLGAIPGATNDRLRRLRRTMLAVAAEVDRAAFPAPWANTPEALGDIVAATPQHRSRCVVDDGRMVAFAISGRASQWGYIQRLAVDPTARRRGLADLLVSDALRWMRRRHVDRVLVNTATDNTAALSLYRKHGFVEQPNGLTILQRTLQDR